jgi:carbon-monoxide dehydrogenase large subunit
VVSVDTTDPEPDAPTDSEPVSTTDPGEVPSDELVGAPVRRSEDRPLLTGDARFTDDVQPTRGLHLALVRSQYGHARVGDVDTTAAAAMDGVVATYTGEDLAAGGLDGPMPGDDPDWGTAVHQPVLAGDAVRYQGQAVAAVVAENRYAAKDAADAVAVDYDRLDAVVDPERAVTGGGPTVHEAAPNNVAFEWESDDADATAAAFDAAAATVAVDLPINRVAAVPMEPRAAVAHPRGDELVVELSTQGPHGVQDHLAELLGLREGKVTVNVPDVGGGFGVKSGAYSGHLLAAWAALDTDRPVKWAATRTEALSSTTHARRHEATARAALDEAGVLTAIEVESVADAGAYIAGGGAFVPTYAFGTRLLGQYDVPAAHVAVTGAYTNTVPTAAYRGAGRPEAAYVIERLASECARELGEDPVAFRRRNQIPPDAFPYETPFGTTYDSGDYGKPLDRALALLDYEAFRERQERAREEGRYLGVGVSTYIEICGGGTGSFEGGLVRMTPGGSVVAHTGTVEIGGGHRTSYAQVVAEELGVDVADVEVVEGDTDRVPEGQGTFGSRSMAMGGNALRESARAVRERARGVAASLLEADVEDVEFDDGAFHVAGAPARSVGIAAVASEAYSGSVPGEFRGLEDTTFFSPEGSTAPFGCHLCVVEVTPDTGAVELQRYVAVDDVGTQINPRLVEGQVVGGIAQSVGQALYEDATYDGSGTLTAGSLQDYAVPRSMDVPDVEWDSTVTPSPNNPLGVKGVGEAGTIGALPAVVNAVVDALGPFGVETVEMPITPEQVWRAVEGEEG